MVSPPRGGRRRLTYVTQWFDPEPAGPASGIAGALREIGYDLRVVTGVPNYPTGTVYRGYRWWRFTRETLMGMPIIRCPIYPSHDRSGFRRAFNYFSFALSSTAFGLLGAKGSDLTVVYSSPATAALPAMIWRRLVGTPFILVVQDLWPDAVFQSGFITSPWKRAVTSLGLKWLDRAATRSASHILVISPGMHAALMSRGVRESKVTVMFNWADEPAALTSNGHRSLRRDLCIEAADLLLMYAGNLGEAQGLDVWLEAIGRCQELTGIHFVFVGDGTRRLELEIQARRLGLCRVHFLKPVHRSRMPSYYSEADAQIVSLRDTPLFAMTIPSKIQTVLAHQSAVLAALAGDAAKIVEDSGAGFLARPGDAQSIEDAIRRAAREGRRLLRARGQLGYAFYQRTMSQEQGKQRLMRAVEDAISSDGVRRT